MALDTSDAEVTIKARIRSRAVYLASATRPILDSFCRVSSLVATMVDAGSSSRRATMASSTLIVPAGRCRACGANAARISPLSSSATTHEAAVSLSGGRPAFDGSTTPQSPIRSPPTGRSGTSSGGIGSPSPSSATGGGDTAVGHTAGGGGLLVVVVLVLVLPVPLGWFEPLVGVLPLLVGCAALAVGAMTANVTAAATLRQ